MIQRFNFIFILFFVTNPLFSQDNSAEKVLSLDMQTAVDLALKQNLDIKSEKFNNDSLKWAMVTSWNNLLPTASISGSMSKNDVNDPVVRRSTTYRLSGNVAGQPGFKDYIKKVVRETEETRPNWSLSTNFNVRWQLQATDAFNIYDTVLKYQSGKISLEIAKNKIIRDIKKNYYSLILQKEELVIDEEQYNNAYDRYLKEKIRYENGKSPRLKMLNAQVAYMNRKPTVIQKKNNYQNAVLKFKSLLGLKPEVDLNLTGTIQIEKLKTAAEFEKMIAAIDLNKNIEIEKLKQDIQSQRNRIFTTAAKMAPTFTVSWAISPKFLNDLETDPLFDDLENDWDYENGKLTLSLQMALDPLFPLSKDQVSILQTQYNILDKQIAMEQKKQNLEQSIQSLLLKLTKSIESINVLTLNIEVAEEAYKLEEEAYNYGSKELTDLKNAEFEYKNAKLKLLQEQYRYLEVLFDLEYNLGTKIITEN